MEIVALLLNSNYKPVSYTFLDYDTFTIENVPIGTYYLLIDIIGIPCKPQLVSLSEKNPHKHLRFSLKNDTLTNISSDKYKNELLVSPNPFHSEIFVTTGEHANDFTIELFSLTGKLVHTGLGKTNINLSSLAKGTYILKYTNKTSIHSAKIVKY